MKLLLLRILVIALGAAAVVYGADYLSLRFNVPRRAQYGQVQVQKFYAVTLKNKKTEYMSADPEIQTCVHSLFPHFGDSPCWYLESHKRQQIKLDPGSRSDFWSTP